MSGHVHTSSRGAGASTCLKEICTAVVDETLICRREPFNTADPFAVTVVKNSGGEEQHCRRSCSQENIVCLFTFPGVNLA